MAYALDRASRRPHVKRRFNDPDDPLAFLIVTAKLLTGFDAPIEQVMYLDRPLRRHTLFQAITRTNRRYTNPTTGQEKRYGLIVDYIGLGKQIAQALKAADPDTRRQAPRRRGRASPPSSRPRSTRACRRGSTGIDRTDHSFAALPGRASQRLADTRGHGRVRQGLHRRRRPCGSSSTRTRSSTPTEPTTSGWRRCTRRSSPPEPPTTCCGTGSARRPSRWSTGTSTDVDSHRHRARRSRR